MSAFDNTAMQALSDAGAQCGDCGDQPGDRICPDCERHYRWCVDALRKAGWASRAETLNEAADALVTAFDWSPGDRPTVEAVRNALRLMARGALPAGPVPVPDSTGDESAADAAVRRSVDSQFPIVAAFLAEGDAGELERLREQRRFLLEQLAKKGARSGEADEALREFLIPDTEPGSHEPTLCNDLRDAIGDDPKGDESR